MDRRAADIVDAALAEVAKVGTSEGAKRGWKTRRGEMSAVEPERAGPRARKVEEGKKPKKGRKPKADKPKKGKKGPPGEAGKQSIAAADESAKAAAAAAAEDGPEADKKAAEAKLVAQSARGRNRTDEDRAALAARAEQLAEEAVAAAQASREAREAPKVDTDWVPEGDKPAAEEAPAEEAPAEEPSAPAVGPHQELTNRVNQAGFLADHVGGRAKEIVDRARAQAQVVSDLLAEGKADEAAAAAGQINQAELAEAEGLANAEIAARQVEQIDGALDWARGLKPATDEDRDIRAQAEGELEQARLLAEEAGQAAAAGDWERATRAGEASRDAAIAAHDLAMRYTPESGEEGQYVEEDGAFEPDWETPTTPEPRTPADDRDLTTAHGHQFAGESEAAAQRAELSAKVMAGLGIESERFQNYVLGAREAADAAAQRAKDGDAAGARNARLQAQLFADQAQREARLAGGQVGPPTPDSIIGALEVADQEGAAIEDALDALGVADASGDVVRAAQLERFVRETAGMKSMRTQSQIADYIEQQEAASIAEYGKGEGPLGFLTALGDQGPQGRERKRLRNQLARGIQTKRNEIDEKAREKEKLRSAEMKQKVGAFREAVRSFQSFWDKLMQRIEREAAAEAKSLGEGAMDIRKLAEEIVEGAIEKKGTTPGALKGWETRRAGRKNISSSPSYRSPSKEERHRKAVEAGTARGAGRAGEKQPKKLTAQSAEAQAKWREVAPEDRVIDEDGKRKVKVDGKKVDLEVAAKKDKALTLGLSQYAVAKQCEHGHAEGCPDCPSPDGPGGGGEPLEKDDGGKVDLTPPEGARQAARRGLELRREHGRGGLSTGEAGKQGIGSGVARARDLAEGNALSPKTVRRMHAFFSRHAAYKKHHGDKTSAAYISWQLWGGDAGASWAKRKVEEMDRKDGKKEKSAGGGPVEKAGTSEGAKRGWRTRRGEMGAVEDDPAEREPAAEDEDEGGPRPYMVPSEEDLAGYGVKPEEPGEAPEDAPTMEDADKLRDKAEDMADRMELLLAGGASADENEWEQVWDDFKGLLQDARDGGHDRAAEAFQEAASNFMHGDKTGALEQVREGLGMIGVEAEGGSAEPSAEGGPGVLGQANEIEARVAAFLASGADTWDQEPYEPNEAAEELWADIKTLAGEAANAGHDEAAAHFEEASESFLESSIGDAQSHLQAGIAAMVEAGVEPQPLEAPEGADKQILGWQQAGGALIDSLEPLGHAGAHDLSDEEAALRRESAVSAAGELAEEFRGQAKMAAAGEMEDAVHALKASQKYGGDVFADSEAINHIDHALRYLRHEDAIWEQRNEARDILVAVQDGKLDLEEAVGYLRHISSLSSGNELEDTPHGFEMEKIREFLEQTPDAGDPDKPLLGRVLDSLYSEHATDEQKAGHWLNAEMDDEWFDERERRGDNYDPQAFDAKGGLQPKDPEPKLKPGEGKKPGAAEAPAEKPAPAPPAAPMAMLTQQNANDVASHIGSELTGFKATDDGFEMDFEDGSLASIYHSGDYEEIEYEYDAIYSQMHDQARDFLEERFPGQFTYGGSLDEDGRFTIYATRKAQPKAAEPAPAPKPAPAPAPKPEAAAEKPAAPTPGASAGDVLAAAKGEPDHGKLLKLGAKRMADESAKRDADKSKHGLAEAKKRHRGRMEKMANAIQSWTKAAARAQAAKDAGMKTATKIFEDRARELHAAANAPAPTAPEGAAKWSAEWLAAQPVEEQLSQATTTDTDPNNWNNFGPVADQTAGAMPKPVGGRVVALGEEIESALDAAKKQKNYDKQYERSAERMDDEQSKAMASGTPYAASSARRMVNMANSITNWVKAASRAQAARDYGLPVAAALFAHRAALLYAQGQGPVKKHHIRVDWLEKAAGMDPKSIGHSIVDGLIEKVGTSEGAKRGWKTRRGQMGAVEPELAGPRARAAEDEETSGEEMSPEVQAAVSDVQSLIDEIDAESGPYGEGLDEFLDDIRDTWGMSREDAEREEGRLDRVREMSARFSEKVSALRDVAAGNPEALEHLDAAATAFGHSEEAFRGLKDYDPDSWSWIKSGMAEGVHHTEQAIEALGGKKPSEEKPAEKPKPSFGRRTPWRDQPRPGPSGGGEDYHAASPELREMLEGEDLGEALDSGGPLGEVFDDANHHLQERTEEDAWESGDVRGAYGAINEGAEFGLAAADALDGAADRLHREGAIDDDAYGEAKAAIEEARDKLDEARWGADYGEPKPGVKLSPEDVYVQPGVDGMQKLDEVWGRLHAAHEARIDGEGNIAVRPTAAEASAGADPEGAKAVSGLVSAMEQSRWLWDPKAADPAGIRHDEGWKRRERGQMTGDMSHAAATTARGLPEGHPAKPHLEEAASLLNSKAGQEQEGFGRAMRAADEARRILAGYKADEGGGEPAEKGLALGTAAFAPTATRGEDRHVAARAEALEKSAGDAPAGLLDALLPGHLRQGSRVAAPNPETHRRF